MWRIHVPLTVAETYLPGVAKTNRAMKAMLMK